MNRPSTHTQVVRARLLDGPAARTAGEADHPRDEDVDEALDPVSVGTELFSSSFPNNEDPS